MQKFDKNNSPPVTITGVAPWAMLGNNNNGASNGNNGSISSVGSTAMGYSTTTMPGNRVPRPFNPVSSRPGAPPNALSCTIQEARQARMRAEAKALENGMYKTTLSNLNYIDLYSLFLKRVENNSGK